MGYYDRNNKSGQRNNFSSRGFGRQSFGGNREDREMHRAVCSSCGKDCSVPFAPTGRKPVYCNECFKNNGGGNDSKSYQDRRPSFNRRPDYGNRPDFERKTEFKPQNNEQFIAINRKLDKIMEMLAVNKVKPEEKVIATPKKTKKLKNATPITTD